MRAIQIASAVPAVSAIAAERGQAKSANLSRPIYREIPTSRSSQTGFEQSGAISIARGLHLAPSRCSYAPGYCKRR